MKEFDEDFETEYDTPRRKKDDRDKKLRRPPRFITGGVNRWTFYLIIIAVIVFVIFLIIFKVTKKNIVKDMLDESKEIAKEIIIGEEGKVTTVSKSTLEKVFMKSDLSTGEYRFNSIARKYNETGYIVYYVKYEGYIKAGIDFSKIKIDCDEEKKIINITIPEVEIQDVTVKMETLDYIFKDESYETESVSQEAYKLAEEDLKSKAESATELKETARQNAYDTVEALVRPWIAQLDTSYTVNIK